jgi:hypothetical protein
MPVTPALRRLRRKDHKFEASLAYIAKSFQTMKRNPGSLTYGAIDGSYFLEQNSGSFVVISGVFAGLSLLLMESS